PSCHIMSSFLDRNGDIGAMANLYDRCQTWSWPMELEILEILALVQLHPTRSWPIELLAALTSIS
ncbi:unnamed protein product, partial [marine sediment metagenome]